MLNEKSTAKEIEQQNRNTKYINDTHNKALYGFTVEELIKIIEKVVFLLAKKLEEDKP